ncbi:MAG TPA: hypothetical protein VFW11_20855 [Cyclobacteriaceae bacterium]|nr:hypothetical protein [Cyclobacteriaceae bacterium]
MSLLNLHSVFFSRTSKFIALAVFFACLSFAGYSQNSKGDKPVSNKGKVREVRFKTRSKQGDKAKTKDVAGRRVRTKNKSSANQASVNYQVPIAAKSARKRAKAGEKAGKPVGATLTSQPRNNQNAWKGGHFGRRVQSRSAEARAQNVYSNRDELAMLKRVQRDPNDNGKRKGKVVPRSASRAYLAKRSVNPMSRFSRKTKKGEVAFLTDPAGRRIRGKNYETPRPGIVSAGDPYHGRKRIGDRPYNGPSHGGYKSVTRQTPQAWKGDVTGRRVRGRNYQSKVNTGGGIARYSLGATLPRFGDRQSHARRKGIGYSTATTPGEKRTGKSPLPPRTPGIGAKGVGNFTGHLKAKRPEKVGGSVSGKNWNNNHTPLPVRQPSSAAQRAGTFQGNVKWKRPEKGGGSVSGKLWNNNESPIPGQPPAAGSQRALSFQGNIKGGKPEKGGGSVSFKHWNNKGKPIQVQPPPERSQRALAFQGNIKGHKPDKAGGSVSGKLWNNDEEPIRVEPPHKGARSAYAYTGDVRLKKLNRSYARSPTAVDNALKQRRPDKAAYEANELQVKVKQYNYVRNPSSARDALKVREPGKAFVRVSDYQGNIKMKKFDLFAKNDLHPDAKFVKTNKNNVPEERDLLTNFKLWWSHTFKKNETQPDHLKEKIRKPRYDNGEQGLWYD